MKRDLKLLFLLALTLALVKVKAQKESLTLQLKIENMETGFLEPLFYSFELTNTSPEIQELRVPWDIIIPELQLFEEKTGEWKKLDKSDFSDDLKYNVNAREHHPGKQTFFFKPKDSFTKSFTYLPIEKSDSSKQYIFRGRKKARLRAVYFPNLGDKTTEIISNEVEIKIKPYRGQDRLAAKWLLSQTIPHFIFELPLMKHYWGIYEYRYKIAIRDKTEEFTKRFPDSKFTPWANLNLAHHFLVKVDRKPPNEALANLRQAETQLYFVFPKAKNSSVVLRNFLRDSYDQVLQKKPRNTTLNYFDQYFEELQKVNRILSLPLNKN